MTGGQTPQTIHEYFEVMATPGTYIEGNLEIQAACKALNVNIHIFGIDDLHNREITVTTPDHYTADVYLVHYDAPGAAAHYRYGTRDLPQSAFPPQFEPPHQPHEPRQHPTPTTARELQKI